jgi:hypothetical protein
MEVSSGSVSSGALSSTEACPLDVRTSLTEETHHRNKTGTNAADEII